MKKMNSRKKKQKEKRPLKKKENYNSGMETKRL